MGDFKILFWTLVIEIIVYIVSLFIDKDFVLSFLKYWYIFVIVLFVVFIIDMVRIILDPIKTALWRSKWYKFRLSLDEDNIFLEKKYIVNDINGRINLARKEFDHTRQALPRLVKVDWIEDEKKNATTYDLNDGEFVVKLHKSKCQEENIIDMTYAVSKRTTLNGVRHIVAKNKDYEDAIDSIMVEKIIANLKNHHVLDFYFQNYLSLKTSSVSFSDYYKKLKEIDHRGMFTRIFILELFDFANRIRGKSFDNILLGQIEYFANFLYNVNPANTSTHNADLSYNKAYIRTGVLLFSEEKMLSQGPSIYVDAVSNFFINTDVYSFYILHYIKEGFQNWGKMSKGIQFVKSEIVKFPTIQLYEETEFNILDDFGINHRISCSRYIVHKFENKQMT